MHRLIVFKIKCKILTRSIININLRKDVYLLTFALLLFSRGSAIAKIVGVNCKALPQYEGKVLLN